MGNKGSTYDGSLYDSRSGTDGAVGTVGCMCKQSIFVAACTNTIAIFKVNSIAFFFFFFLGRNSGEVRLRFTEVLRQEPEPSIAGYLNAFVRLQSSS